MNNSRDERTVGKNSLRSRRAMDAVDQLEDEVDTLRKKQWYLKIAVGMIALDTMGVPTDQLWEFVIAVI